MKRSTPIRTDPAKQKAWQERSRGGLQRRAAPGATDSPRKTIRSRRRPSEAPLRAETIRIRGGYCRACGTVGGLEMDHIVPKSQARQHAYDVRNTCMLCAPHHLAKTEKRLRYRREWLDPDQLAFLADIGWVAWDSDGLPYGRGWKGFEPLNPNTGGEQR